MTLIEDAPTQDDVPDVEVDDDELEALLDDAPPTRPSDADDQDEDGGPLPVSMLWRPILASALSTTAAGLVVGGIFGSWGARATGLVAAAFGAGFAFLVLRSHKPNTMQAAFPVVAIVVSAFSLVVRGESPGELPTLIGDAINSGKLFSPPVPYDPGWTPLILLIISSLSFAAAWVGTVLERPRLAVAIPLPVIAIAALTQPDDGEFIAGLCAFLPVLAALSVLFRGDTARSEGLGGEFEIKRALRSVLLTIPLIVGLVALSSTSILFPEPVYDPTSQPQKPKPIPLSAAGDRVLFEVETADGLTGPWRAGVLDVYDEDAWKLPPFDKSRFEDIGPAGVISTLRSDAPRNSVAITLRDLGDSSVLPILGGTNTFSGDTGGLVLDPRAELVRVKEGRAPRDFTYVLDLPRYPTEEQLESVVSAADAEQFEDQLEVPAMPALIRDLLATVGSNPWTRLDLLRQTMLDNVTAKGAGSPDDISVDRALELFEPDAKATPFEIVATEAMLARWAGIPSRIGFGFDGLNDEEGIFTVRPRNSAQWLEVYWPTFGWVPLIGAPKQAEASLDDSPARFNPEVVTGSDVAVEVFLPFKVDNLEQLYERIRNELLFWSPIIGILVILWLSWPIAAKAHRRSKRRRWAAARGPAERIAVEYAEFRDLATDLNVGDIYTTPLEFTYTVRDDEEHEHFAWLHTRSLYGDLRNATEEDVMAAERMGASLRRRLQRGQPGLIQASALISRASIELPYTNEIPNIRVPKMPVLPKPWKRRSKKRKAVRSSAPGGRLRKLIPSRSS